MGAQRKEQNRRVEGVGESLTPWRNLSRRLRIVLPAYNEEENLGKLLERIDQTMHEAGLAYEIIVVDDGSSDRTAEIAARYAGILPVILERHERNKGLGATIRDGLRLASERAAPQDVIISLDADNSHGPGVMLNMLQLVREGNDLVIASRFQPGAYVRGVPPSRVLFSNVASILFRLVFPLRGIRDYTCGYRAYRAGLLKQAFEKYGDSFINRDGFECMVDILLKLRPLNPIMREVPLVLRYDEKGGASKMKVTRTILRTLTLMIRRRFSG